MRIRTLLLSVLISLALVQSCFALGQPRYVEFTASPDNFPVVRENAASLFVDAGDFPGVLRAAKNLVTDIHRVTGKDAPLTVDEKSLPAHVIIIGTIGKSPILDRLAKAGKIDLTSIAGKWDSFFTQVVSDPMPGVSNALVIAGSDKRGTIYGIYDLSEQIGVSPWY